MWLLTRLSLANRMIVGMICGLIVVFGLVSTGALRQELLPSIKSPGATVMANFSGASPDAMERDVTEPLEAALRAVPGIQNVRSTTASGSAVVSVTWDFGDDSEKKLNDLRGAISSVEPTLPTDVKPTLFAGGTDDLPAMYLSVSSQMSPEELAQQLNTVTLPQLRGIDGVRAVTVTGQNEQQVTVTVRGDDAKALKVDPSSIGDIIKASGLVVPAGSSTVDGTTMAVEVGTQVTSLDELKGLPLPTENGPVSLSSVADVVQAPVAATTISRVDGNSSLSLAIMKTPDGNVVGMSHAINALTPTLAAELGKGAQFTTLFDQAPMIEQSIHDLSVEGGLGLLFAVLIILLFLFSVRATIITAISIPLSLLVTMIALQIGGFSLNILTLGALTVAVGRVVDDSIVVIENIKRHQGTNPLTVATITAAVKEVAGAITASTITTVAVFLPIAFVTGQVGELFRPFSVTVTVALLASLIVALTIVPVLSYWFMRKAPKPVSPEKAERARLLAEKIDAAEAKRLEKERAKAAAKLDRKNAARIKRGQPALAADGTPVVADARTVSDSGMPTTGALAGDDHALAGAGAAAWASDSTSSASPGARTEVLQDSAGSVATATATASVRPRSAAGSTDDRSHEDEPHDRLQRGYLPILHAVLGRPVATLLVAALVFGGTLVLATQLKLDFLGDQGDNSLAISQELPVGTSLAATNEATGKIEAVLADTASVKTYLTTVGSGSDSTSNVASFTVQLEKDAKPDAVAADIRDQLAKLDGIGETTVGAAAGGAGSSDVSVTIKGDNSESLRAGTEALQAAFTKVDGLDNVKSDLAAEQPVLKITVDRLKAATYGFTQAQVGTAVAGALRGTPLGTLRIDDVSNNIVIESQHNDATPEQIGQLVLPVTPLQQQLVQKAAMDKVTADQEAMSQRMQDEATAQLNKQMSDIRTARSEARAQINELSAQLAALLNAPMPEPSPVDPNYLAAMLAAQQQAEQIAALQQAIGQLQGSVTGADEQLTALAKSQADAATQRAEQDQLAQASKDAANVTAQPLRLVDLAVVEQQKAPSSITRIDGIRAVTVTATPTGDDLGATNLAVNDAIASVELPAGVTIDIGGVQADQQDSFAQLGLAMLLAIALVYLVMVATFKSVIQPLMLLVSIPFAATGAIGLLLLTDTPLGIPAMIGLLMLIGIVVTNAIVLIDLVNTYRERGSTVKDAVIHGARLRLRPIIMTACATIFALIPMSLGLTGGGVFISRPLAIVVIGGLVSSTLLTLILVPVLYLLIENRRELKRTKKAARRAAAGQAEHTPDGDEITSDTGEIQVILRPRTE